MMARYRAKADLWINTSDLRRQVMVKAGETFESDEVPGRNWHPTDEAAEAAVVAKFGAVLPDRPANLIGGADSLFRARTF